MLVLGSPNVGKSGISSSLSTFVVVLVLNYYFFVMIKMFLMIVNLKKFIDFSLIISNYNP